MVALIFCLDIRSGERRMEAAKGSAYALKQMSAAMGGKNDEENGKSSGKKCGPKRVFPPARFASEAFQMIRDVASLNPPMFPSNQIEARLLPARSHDTQSLFEY